MLTTEDELKSLMIAGQNGDAASYRALLDRLSNRLRAYYKRRIESAGQGVAEAEDLVQEALLAVHTQRHTYDPDEPLTPWVYAIARYKLIDHLRRTRSSLAQVPIDDNDETIAQDDHIAVESAYDLHRLMNALPKKMRCAIQCVKLDGLSVAEASTRCSMSESSVKINIHRGLMRLSSLIGRSALNED